MAKQTFSPAAAATAAAGGADKFEVPPHPVDIGIPQTPKEAVEEMLADAREARKNQMLAWDKRENYRTPDGRPMPLSDRQVGSFDQRLPYNGPIFGYYIQNDQVYFGKGGRVVKLEEVPEEMEIRGKVERKEPAIIEKVRPRERVELGLAVARRMRVRQNPNVCRICARYTAVSQADYTAHLAGAHPVELDAFLAGLRAEPAEAEPKQTSA